MPRWLTWSSVIVGLVLLVGAWRYVIRFLPGMPHERVMISLPFAPADDDVAFVNPMGETVNHPDAPHGHPGLDFSWAHPVQIRASADGKVTRISRHGGGPPGDQTWDVEVVSGDYAVRYTELGDSANLRVGQRVYQGDLIGQAGQPPYPGNTNYGTHWEFDYDTFWYDRLCPLTYFDAASRTRIDTLWATRGNTFNGQFPDLCSGDYTGKDQ